MQPIDRLLHRMKWDRRFGSARFSIAYFDRVRGEDVVVPFGSVTLDPERPGTFTFTDEDGVTRHVPLHRVRIVYRDGVAIWRRGREGDSGEG